MLKRLSELINQAEICLENPGLSEGTIEDYRHSAFHPLERRLDTKEYVDSAAILSQEEFFWEQYEKGQISRHTLNWRIRGTSGGCLPLRGAGITMSSRVFHRKRHLLVAVSGLRTGDIATLRLRDIDWKRNEIRLVQGKTAEPLVLPIPKPVLQAVADYILNGRPHTASDRVFVRHLAPSDFWLMHYSLNNDLYYKFLHLCHY